MCTKNVEISLAKQSNRKSNKFLKSFIIPFAKIFFNGFFGINVIAKKEQEYRFFGFRDTALEILQLYMDTIDEEAWMGEVHSEEYIEEYIINTISDVYKNSIVFSEKNFNQVIDIFRKISKIKEKSKFLMTQNRGKGI